MKKFIGVIIIHLLFIAGCSYKEAPVLVLPPAPAVLVEPTKEKAAWEPEWDKTLSAARKEGVVMVYTNRSSDMAEAWREVFEKRFGIKMDRLSGRGAELAQKILAERRAGLYLPDIHTSGGEVTVLSLKPAGALTPIKDWLVLPEVADPKFWYGSKHPWVDKDYMIFNSLAYPSGEIGINTNLVKKGEVKELKDLLSPKWKGKIVLNDPTVTGTGFKFFSIVVHRFAWGIDFWREFASKQEPLIIRDQRLMMDWLSLGKVAILVTPETEPYLRAREAGAPIDTIDFKEASYLTGDTVMVMDRAPHPNAAKVFLNWILSREGQEIYQRLKASQSARVDLPTNIPEMKYREPGIEYWSSMDEEYIKRSAQYIPIAREIFEPLMR